MCGCSFAPARVSFVLRRADATAALRLLRPAVGGERGGERGARLRLYLLASTQAALAAPWLAGAARREQRGGGSSTGGDNDKVDLAAVVASAEEEEESARARLLAEWGVARGVAGSVGALECEVVEVVAPPASGGRHGGEGGEHAGGSAESNTRRDDDDDEDDDAVVVVVASVLAARDPPPAAPAAVAPRAACCGRGSSARAEATDGGGDGDADDAQALLLPRSAFVPSSRRFGGPQLAAVGLERIAASGKSAEALVSSPPLPLGCNAAMEAGIVEAAHDCTVSGGQRDGASLTAMPLPSAAPPPVVPSSPKKQPATGGSGACLVC